jgi:hypothetical protein
VLLLGGGCAVGGGGEPEAGPALREELAVRPQPLGEHESTVPDAPEGSVTTRPDGATTSTSLRPATGSTTSTTTASAAGGPRVSYVPTAVVTDRTGDPDGAPPPPYGDLVGLRLEDDGTRARFTVEVGAEVPARLAVGEQVAVSVDLWRGDGESESEYQVYARGNDEGWLAWLDTPSDFVPYPGTFELGGSTLVFTVPWSALGGRRNGSLSALVEWEKDKAVVLADASADRAPEGRATHSFSL